ncbi:hypothetical protein UlMin_032284 [Ulmus minor]
MVLRRSSSSCVETEKKEKDCENKSVGGFDEKSEMWVVDYMSVSRLRSLCSFRNGGWFRSKDGGDFMVSGARSSISYARSSNVTACMILDLGISGFSEAKPRRSDFGFSDSEPRRSNFRFSDSEPRKSGFGFSDLGPRRSGFGFSDSEQRKSSFGFSEIEPRKILSLKESDFSGMDESSFIDLKLDYSAKFKLELSSESAFGNMR